LDNETSLKAREARIVIEFEQSVLPDFAHLSLFIDPHKIAQVIRNLMSNALKFTRPSGSVRVALNVVEVEDELHAQASNAPSTPSSFKIFSRRSGVQFVQPMLAPTYALTVSVTDTGAGISIVSLSLLLPLPLSLPLYISLSLSHSLPPFLAFNRSINQFMCRRIRRSYSKASCSSIQANYKQVRVLDSVSTVSLYFHDYAQTSLNKYLHC
jgi:hypothetical protein